MTEPTQEQVAAERERAHEALSLQQGRGRLICAWTGKSPNVHGVGCTAVATALARRALEAEAKGRDDERRRVRLELSCVWDPFTTDRLNELCKTCRWPRNMGPYIHIDPNDPDADAIRALRGAR